MKFRIFLDLFLLQHLGAASLGVDYVKVGLYGLKTPQQAIFLLQQVNKAAKECNPKIKVVAAGYADAEKIGAIDPLLIPEIAKKAQVDVAMLDTATKDGTNLFDYLTIEQLKTFVDSAHNFGLEAALAGSLRKQDLACYLRFRRRHRWFKRSRMHKQRPKQGTHNPRTLVAELVSNCQASKEGLAVQPERIKQKRGFSRTKKTSAQDNRYEDGRILCSMCTKPHPIAKKAYEMFFDSNLGDQGLFPATAQLEREVIAQLGIAS